MACEVMRSALLDQRRRVEVHRQEGGKWSLARRGSPGNLSAFEDECMVDGALPADASTVIVAVRLGRTSGSKGYAGNARLVGAAFIDCQGRAIRFTEFEDDEQLSTLESLVCQQGARECLVSVEGPAADATKLQDVMELCEVPISIAKKGAFSEGAALQDVCRLRGVKQEELHSAFDPAVNRLAISACCGLISYLDLMGQPETHGQWALEWVAPGGLMRLDSGAMRALSVEPVPGEPDKAASLYGILSHCKTAMGGRLVRKWLKQPLISAFDIEARLDLVAAFVNGFETRSLLRDEVLPKMACDLDRLARKFFGGKGDMKDVVVLYQFVEALPRLLSALEAHADSGASEDEVTALKQRFTEPLTDVHDGFRMLVELVEKAVDLEKIQKNQFVVQSHFEPKLKILYAEQEEIQAQIREHHDSLRDRLGIDALKLEESLQFGWAFRVTRKDEQLIRDVKRIEKLQTKKDGVVFRDSRLTDLNAEYREAAKKYKRESAQLEAKVVQTVGTFCPVVQQAHELISELDVLLCFAQVSVTAPSPFVRPTLVPPEDDTQRIVLKGCRHPCVERMDGVAFIKNDIELVRREGALQIVTGPNMGGKSTYIRSVGVNVLLAQIGCFVACDEAHISPVDAILARVGAGDVQSRGVSTFMAEMLETSAILKNATESSLVLIDELGRGTSTYDGFGLAWAISEHLAKRVGCVGLFATHFHELTALASHIPGKVSNKHVSAHVDDNGQIAMLYRIADGPSDQSYGVHVAAGAGFPAQVVQEAKAKLADLEEDNGGSVDACDDDGADGPPDKRSGGEMDCGTEERTAKRSRTVLSEEERAEGMEQVRRSLKAFAALPLDTLSAAEAEARLGELKAELRASANPLVARLCAQAAAKPEACGA